jgi:2-polyprenyl-3-methyl-5-hydroxy-6-metoxy-1,4-benzoquinol methylase
LVEEALESVPKLRDFDRDYVKRMMESFWYQKIELGNGFFTPGTFDMREYLDKFPMPDDLTGKKVLELASAEGFFSFEMEKRGADVVAVDAFENAIEHLEFLKKVLGYKTEIKKMDILEDDLSILGKFDIVWATNIMQHVTPKHNFNSHPKDDFIQTLKVPSREGTTIVCSSNLRSDINLLKKSFDNVEEVSKFSQKGFKVRTQTVQDPEIIVVKITITEEDLKRK